MGRWTGIPKYRNRPTEYAGRRYASKAEAARAEEHDLRCKAIGGWWIPQVKLDIGGIPYTIDFLVGEVPAYEDDVDHLTWEVCAEDVKGMEKQRDRDIQRLWAAGHGLPMPLVILKRKGSSWERRVIVPASGPVPVVRPDSPARD